MNVYLKPVFLKCVIAELKKVKLEIYSLFPQKLKSKIKEFLYTNDERLPSKSQIITELKSKLSTAPLNKNLYLQLAQTYRVLDRTEIANACYRTASYLGAVIDFSLLNLKIPDLLKFPIDQYIRFKTVADEINYKYVGASVLDVGGGNGLLGYFLPNQKYFLVDIDTTGVSALPLPFENNSFDVVCATDTLEHIPRNSRDEFLYEILRVAKNEVHIVVPTSLPPEYPDYNKFFYEITGAFQTKEHIEYGVPTVAELHSLLEPYKSAISYEIMPSGSLMNISLLLLHYLSDRRKREKLSEINEYFNKNFYNEIKKGIPTIGHHIKIIKEAKQ